MAYFFRDDAYRHRPADRPQGRRTKPVQLDPLTLAPPKGRDVHIDEQISGMQDTIGKEDFLMKKLTNAPSHAHGKKSQPDSARVQNNIFPANAKPDTPPALRLRPDPPAEVLQKLWQEDRSKDQHAAKMANSADPVERMMQCQYPMPHPPSPTHARKRAATLPREPNQANEPEGLRGVGNYCEPPKARGPRCRPVEYELPELKLKPRTKGRKRGNIPEDQWSFVPGGEAGSPRTAR